ncbi:hypothetical protein [Engelhardtia mirabilis]|uniref:Uncharacterized protein n=1 Tax=Engelhardtia mirabilis TaxID=2528011 RepID=A0A518BL05_9BACT|nr:hypothetical protein Pla133_27430 [Planctomycetes bacterium Pla133]QDV01981.1 hypothetical protein Pla86_27420 [Planctomycetes bacterium Pla86]
MTSLGPSTCEGCKHTLPTGFARYFERADDPESYDYLCFRCAIRRGLASRNAVDRRTIFEQIETIVSSDRSELWGEALYQRNLICLPGRLTTLLEGGEIRNAG